MDARIDSVPTPPMLEPTPPPATPLDIATKRTKAAVPAPIGKPVGASHSPALSLAQAVKGPSPWAKAVEDPGIKAKPTLRDIQEAEARQAETLRKAAGPAALKERPAVSRSGTEDMQTVTTSWGLPTSQAGQAPRPVPKEPSPLTPGSAVGAPGAAGVWTNAPKPPAVAPKKTVKQIQEEEERNKRITAKDASVIESARRGYAQTANKVRSSSSSCSSRFDRLCRRLRLRVHGRRSASTASPTRSLPQLRVQRVLPPRPLLRPWQRVLRMALLFGQRRRPSTRSSRPHRSPRTSRSLRHRRIS